MLEGPAVHKRNPLKLMLQDVAGDRAATVPWPPGSFQFSLANTQRFSKEPLSMYLEYYQRYGPIFTIRVLHCNVVIMLGPEANHYMLVSHADNFTWRDGYMRNLIPLLGDGMLTIDGAFHRSSRKLMLPAFHSKKIASATEIINDEFDRAAEDLIPGAVIDLYDWVRHLALRVALRALFGLDPDRARAGDFDAVTEFENALSFHARDFALQIARGPFTPYSKLIKSRARLDKLIYGEIERRRSSGERGDDVLSLLLDAEDEDGQSLEDRHIRDHAMTLLFAGHDTTSSSVTFMFYELSKNPELLDDPVITPEMIFDETLRMYPPAYIGPRRSVNPYEFAGATVPGNAHVNYCSWASHHLPEIWDSPETFDPMRFTEAGKKAMRKGQYIPFGGGSRTCIGMRFGKAEVGAIMRAIFERCRLEVLPGYELNIRLAPTISPTQGMPVIVHRAEPARVLSNKQQAEVEVAA